MYIYVLKEMTSNFFIFNQQNYARYTVKYYDSLLDIENSQPGLKQNIENGGMFIKRSQRSFSRSPVDLVVEQTINCNAANKKTGIIYSTNSINSRKSG